MTNGIFCTINICAMNTIKIIPIFDQSAPKVWNDFLQIRASAMRYIYDYKMSSSEYMLAFDEMRNMWHRRRLNFAFGAYQDDRMIGFIQGYGSSQTAIIENLYLHPDFMGQGIGWDLLSRVERAVTFSAKWVELVALVRAQPFYERHWYIPISRGSNRYTKKLPDKVSGACVLPVFRLTDAVARACNDIANKNGNAAISPKLINQEHVPMFVYLDGMSNVRGYVIGGADKNNSDIVRMELTPNYMTQYISNKLMNEFAALNSIQKTR